MKNMNNVVRVCIGGFFAVALVVQVITYQSWAYANQPIAVTLSYQRGLVLEPNANKSIDHLVNVALQNPAYHIRIVGHTSSGGSEAANLDLSHQRALEVASNFIENGIDSERVTIEYKGSSKPLPKGSDEGLREYEKRLSRVEVMLDWKR